MTKRMLIDATHPEETRVAVINGNKLEEYDFETVVRKQLKGNIYLVKVSRVEPSLQAAFVDFGGNRHGFLPFPEIHHDYYRIPIADREALLAEERAQAAAQAAREDAEDEAELAAEAEGGTIDRESAVEEIAEEVVDLDEETADLTMAADVSEDVIVDTAAEGESEDEEEGEEEATGDDEPAVDPNVDIIGGDVVEAPVYRSSMKRRYKIQEVIKRNQIMLIQINKEERGNKGAAVTSYISLPGRYCVLMPNSPRGGGVSRKVSNAKDRQRLKKILQELNVPEGMSVILRTAGVARATEEIKRDLDYLLRLWDQIREVTLQSSAPALIYEEGNLIKRAIRDLYKRDIDEVHVAGGEGHRSATEIMRMLMPSHVDRVKLYEDESTPLFHRYKVESQIDEIHNPTVHLKSGGYIVINPTEAMVSIDVNSGRATKGRHIEETALKTNLEAAEEIARQLRLRDQGGLVVIDFIDMEDNRNNRIVERKLRDAMQHDRARIQLGRISAFGLLELSRQRLHPSLVESNFEVCKHCAGSGLVRTVETTAVIVLRGIEEEAMKGRAPTLKVSVPTDVALYIFNNKREMLASIERRHNVRITLHADDALLRPHYNIESVRAAVENRAKDRPAPVKTVDISDLPEIPDAGSDDEDLTYDADEETAGEPEQQRQQPQGNRDRNRGDRNASEERSGEGEGDRRRRRGRRGGRNRNRGGRNRDRNGAPEGGKGDNSSSDDGAPAPAERIENNNSFDASGSPADDMQDNNADGSSRKGWWKRLTE